SLPARVDAFMVLVAALVLPAVAPVDALVMLVAAPAAPVPVVAAVATAVPVAIAGAEARRHVRPVGAAPVAAARAVAALPVAAVVPVVPAVGEPELREADHGVDVEVVVVDVADVVVVAAVVPVRARVGRRAVTAIAVFLHGVHA